ncbi:MAG: hypothetical protein ABWY64_15620 [Tardiphaga sp.]
MFAPATTTSEGRRAPSCPTCFAPMTLLRVVTPNAAAELRVFECRHCAVVMFTEIG